MISADRYVCRCWKGKRIATIPSLCLPFISVQSLYFHLNDYLLQFSLTYPLLRISEISEEAKAFKISYRSETNERNTMNIFKSLIHVLHVCLVLGYIYAISTTDIYSWVKLKKDFNWIWNIAFATDQILTHRKILFQNVPKMSEKFRKYVL